MIQREPTAIIGGLAELVRAIIPMLIIFGYIQWSDNQTAQVMLVIGVAVAVAEKWFTRTQVSPKQDIVTALNMPKGSTVADLKEKVAEENNSK